MNASVGKPLRGTLLFVATVLAATCCLGKTVYVDCRLDDYAGHDGLKPETAFRTIQEGVDAADEEGDTVEVAPGVYSPENSTLTYSASSNLVVIGRGKSHLTITARKGERANTHIVGRHASNGMVNGPDAVRCIYISDSNVSNVFIRGFTIRDGSCEADAASTAAHGGGIGASGTNRKNFLTDCVVSNCWATRAGAVYGVTAIRCIITRNKAALGTSGTGNAGSAGRAANFYQCLIANNEGGGAAVYGGDATSCTIIGNYGGCAAVCSATVYDSILELNAATASDTANYGGNNVCQAEKTASGTPYFKSASNNHYLTDPQVLSPLTGDYRVVAGSSSENRGVYTHIVNKYGGAMYVPDSELLFDLTGAPVRDLNGRVRAGCIQELVTPACGFVQFDQVPLLAPDGGQTIVGSYVGFDTFPAQYKARPYLATGKHLFAYTRVDHGGLVPPEMDDSLWVMPPPSGVMTVQVAQVEKAYYVKPAEEGGSDSNDGLSWATAFATIQRGIDADSSGYVVRVAPGTYGYTANCVELMDMTNVVSITGKSNLRLVGAGAGKSFIRGRPDPNSPSGDGRGDAAVRCVAISNAGLIQGFTLTDGCCGVGSQEADYGTKVRGAGLCISGYTAKAADLTITNCVGVYGVTYNGDCRRLKVLGNAAKYMISCGIHAISCLWAGNRTTATPEETATCIVGRSNSGWPWLVQCTVVGPDRTQWVLQPSTSLTNTICVTGNTFYNDTTPKLTCLGWDFAVNNAQHDAIKEDPLFANRAANDYRVASSSPALGAGTLFDGFSDLCLSGVDGEPMRLDNGRPLLGACQEVLQAVIISDPPYGTLTPSGTVVVEPGATLDITYAPSRARNLTAIVSDGVTNPVPPGVPYVYTFRAPGTAVAGNAFHPEFVYSGDWFVDAVNGDDANDGFTAGTAKLTLTGAVEYALSGDVVHAAPGEYAEGTMFQGTLRTGKVNANRIPSRVALPAGVTLEATAGDPRLTVIRGVWDKDDPDTRGLGPKAVRCVFMGSGSRLKGFTLADGATDNDESVSTETDDNIGSGTLGYAIASGSNHPTFVEDCIYTNCTARRATAYGGNHLRCRFLGNVGVANTAAGRQCSFYDCYFAGNRGATILQSFYRAVNCTIMDDNLNLNGTAVEVTNQPFDSDPRPVRNCLILGTYRVNSGTAAYRCAFQTNGSGGYANKPDALVCSREELLVDAEGRPQFGSPLIDAGSNSYVHAEAAKGDVDALQRIYNERVDIGCYEYDWRAKYAEALGGGVSVTTATSGVKLEDGKVTLADGERIDGVWPRPAADRKTYYGGVAAVTGPGVLSGVFSDGTSDVATVEATAGDPGFSFARGRTELADLGFGFAFEGAGLGELSAFDRVQRGTVLIVR